MKINVAGLDVIGRVILWMIFLVPFGSMLRAQDTLFKSPIYSVTNDRVIQDKYQAVAKSAREIVST